MKNLFKFFAVLALSASVMSCTDKLSSGTVEEPTKPTETVVEDPYITMDASSNGTFEVDNANEEILLSFSTNNNWEVRAIATKGASAEWVSVTPLSGEAGDASVTVTIAGNDSSTPRSTTLLIISGGQSESIAIIQNGTVTTTEPGTGTEPGEPTEPTEPAQSADYDALMAIYNSTNGKGWVESINWGSDKPLSQWSGVQTDQEGNVVNLNLSKNNLSGTLPAEVGNLDHLEYFLIQDNPELVGSIPAEIGDMASLVSLQANRNGFTGAIPAEITNNSTLRFLQLGFNSLVGSLPADFSAMVSLEHFDVSGNKEIVGSIPASLGTLANLEVVMLNYNMLTGEIPSTFGDLQKLHTFWADDNQLTGEFPAFMCKIPTLTYLMIRGNNLSGSIPAEIGNMKSIFDMDLSKNDFSGSIPAELANLTTLKYLDLYNNQLSGTVPQAVLDMPNFQAAHSTTKLTYWRINPQQGGFIFEEAPLN